MDKNIEEELELKQFIEEKQDAQLLQLYHTWELKQMDFGWNNTNVNED